MSASTQPVYYRVENIPTLAPLSLGGATLALVLCLPFLWNRNKILDEWKKLL
jgi:hypothetical protein